MTRKRYANGFRSSTARANVDHVHEMYFPLVCGVYSGNVFRCKWCVEQQYYNVEHICEGYKSNGNILTKLLKEIRSLECNNATIVSKIYRQLNQRKQSFRSQQNFPLSTRFDLEHMSIELESRQSIIISILQNAHALSEIASGTNLVYNSDKSNCVDHSQIPRFIQVRKF